MRPAGALAAVLAALVAAGCGGGGPTEASSEQQQAIEAAIADYEAAIADGDGKAGCATLDPAQVEQLGGERACAEIFKTLAAEGQDALRDGGSEAPVDRIEIADGGKLARVYFEGEEGFTRLLLVDGDWYLSTAPPPAS